MPDRCELVLLMTDTTAPRLLVIDGYTEAAREQLQSGGASVAADLYVGMLERCAPNGIECDVIFPADLGASLPVGKAIRASKAELKVNVRSRSAVLRVAEKVA